MKTERRKENVSLTSLNRKLPFDIATLAFYII